MWQVRHKEGNVMYEPISLPTDEHIGESHEPGTLYNCPACEVKCYCDSVKVILGQDEECVRCSMIRE